jgi:hypothetical protein
LTRYLTHKPNFDELIRELFDQISCFSGAVKIENRIGRNSPEDMMAGPEEAVGRQCFREDGTHLQGPAIGAFSRLLQYFVSRRDMYYETEQ